MPRILLVEPKYKNKYPPLGLMKLATYHRNKGDIVEFYKGEAPYPQIANADRVYINTLFTFYYDLTIETIKHYLKFKNKDAIFIGGIAATLMPDKFKKDTGLNNIIEGQLTSSSVLGYNDNINIDELNLDYDILDDIDYKYPAGDNYFAYTSRGCPRKCAFCGVRILEPNFVTTNNIIEQISRIDDIYGQKRNLLLMDNNILFSDKLHEIVADIRSLGFYKGSTFTPSNPFKLLMDKIHRREQHQSSTYKQKIELENMILKIDKKLSNFKLLYPQYKEIVNKIKASDNTFEAIKENYDFFETLFEKHKNHSKMQRFVDFNQGIDARLISDKNMKVLSALPISPFRLAYDGINETKVYTKAFKTAVKHGVEHFSNYILYNWEDRPEDLWTRLHTAAKLYNQAGGNTRGFSFPMRYAPIYNTDRAFIGSHWNKKYLSAINVIINVTKGVVAQELDFFYKAFGKNKEEFFKILTMPSEFIKFRNFFENCGLTTAWEHLYLSFNEEDMSKLIELLSLSVDEQNKKKSSLNNKERLFLSFYRINKNQVERGTVDIISLLAKTNALFKDIHVNERQDDLVII